MRECDGCEGWVGTNDLKAKIAAQAKQTSNKLKSKSALGQRYSANTRQCRPNRKREKLCNSHTHNSGVPPNRGFTQLCTGCWITNYCQEAVRYLFLFSKFHRTFTSTTATELKLQSREQIIGQGILNTRNIDKRADKRGKAEELVHCSRTPF